MPPKSTVLRTSLKGGFAWRSDGGGSAVADVTGWWRDPDLLKMLGPALADLWKTETPTVVVGLQSRGCLLGPLVAEAIGVGFVEVRKNPSRASDNDEWLNATTPPDYRDRHLTLGFRRRLVAPSDRVVLVDDWIDTGGQGT